MATTPTKNIKNLPVATSFNAGDVAHISQNGVDKQIQSTTILEQLNSGQPFRPNVLTESSTSRTLTGADKAAYISCTNSLTTTITVSSVADSDWRMGEVITVHKEAAGDVVFQGAAGVTVNPSVSGLTLSEVGQVGTLLHKGNDIWDFLTGGSASSSIQGSITFDGVATLVAGTTIEGGVIGSGNWSTYNGWLVQTKWHNSTSKAGGAKYVIKTLAQAATDGDIIDGSGAPDYLGRNHLLSGGTHVAIIEGNDKYKITCNGAVLNDSSAPTRTRNSTVFTEMCNAISRVYIPAGILWIDPDTQVKGSIYGDQRTNNFNSSTIKGDGDLMLMTNEIYCKDLVIENSVTRGKLFRNVIGTAIGRRWWENCLFNSATYHIHSISNAAVDWKFMNCRFGFAQFQSRFFLSTWVYTEFGCYTWQGLDATSSGFLVEDGNCISSSIYGGVFELMGDFGVKYASNTAAGQLNGLLVSGTHFEKNGSVTGAADIEVIITGPTRARCLNVVSCGFFSPSVATQTSRIKVTRSGGGSSRSHNIIGCQSQSSVPLVNDTPDITVLNCDQSSTALGNTVLQMVRSDGNTGAVMSSNVWTPTDASGAGLSLTAGICTWNRHGNMTILYGVVTFPATADVTAITIGGLPFTVSDSAISGDIYSTNALAFGSKLLALSGTTQLRIYKEASVRAVNSDLSGVTITFTIIYKAV